MQHLTELETVNYLTRIDYRGTATIDAATLLASHRRHVMSVPFEAMDVQLGRPIRLELPGLYEKIVVRRRGGFCYELNYPFWALLRELGSSVDLVSARIWSEEAYGPEFDHVALIVHLAEPRLADVGFGKLFLKSSWLPRTGGQGKGITTMSYGAKQARMG